MDRDAFGDRMKNLEMAEAGRRCMPLLPIIARLDGKGFSKFTKGLKRPYDERFSKLMVETVKYLVHETSAVCGYTQSDEITLAWYSSTMNSQVYFDGRIQKMVSVLAAKCSVKFNALVPLFVPEKHGKEAVFDCRVWNVPTLSEAANSFLWREFDATKNSISMAASEYYSHKELMGKNGSEKQEMLFLKGVNWNDYPSFFRRGTYIQRKEIQKVHTAEELESLPPKHAARLNPDLIVTRHVVTQLDLPPLQKITNRIETLFLGADYKLEA
jgi:tRNA(His) guanylyltransferase